MFSNEISCDTNNDQQHMPINVNMP